ncbi:MAG: metallophosphoesterase family protein [Candidatus Aenigmatarchaeota archaeon]
MIKKGEKLILINKWNRFIVVGDLHGDYESYLKTKNFLEKKFSLIYLGDYADRGDFGVEIIEDLIETTRKYPMKVIALKGNHESYSESGEPNFYPSDLIDEVNFKKGNWKNYFKEILKPFFDNLPICALHENFKLFFVHGGISSKIKSLEDLKKPSKRIEEDLLWSDPIEKEGEFKNPRGAGVLFGKNITSNFCSISKIEKIIRSHEPRKALYSPNFEQDGKLITISSTRVYGGRPHILKIENGRIETIYLD